ncbi:phosphohistidine phosphatase SixA [Shewanella litorisediminis]|uniref:Phosphohistidine phosphatase SixA n=1 Tax=Shewanella litorisediminis TaxID=1173586 RepID=A0ABX7FZJ1_9GAMM|nr:phosphohistidine phosphatase SixA [Shewanella litorisediminis]MCL2919523.1 phosphohistidine phosphatase SixA [Shewanella litorisediminis]QRH00440.1 phosphohistidine phosphatase SixA [Shewanella litorisediminis]
MQLFLMRHGEAGYQAQSDRDRTLTDTGRYHTRLMSNFLNRLVTDFDLVLVSPYLRAQQTWQEVATHFPEPRKWVTADDLVPSADPATAASLILAYAEQYKADKVLVISHMPLLGYLVSELVAGTEPPLFATSGVCLLDKHAEQCHQVWMHNPHTIS